MSFNVRDFKNYKHPKNMMQEMVSFDLKQFLKNYEAYSKRTTFETHVFRDYFFKKFGKEADLLFVLNANRLLTSNTFSEEEDYFFTYESSFPKQDYEGLFRHGLRLDDLGDYWKTITKSFEPMGKKHGSYYFSSEEYPKEKINSYYFDVYIKKVLSYNDKAPSEPIKNWVPTPINLDSVYEKYEKNTEKQYELNQLKKKMTKERKIEKKSTGGKMDIQSTISQVVAVNRDAAKQAALIKVGDTANQTVVDILKKSVLPKKYQKFAGSPFFKLAIANVVSVAMKNLIPNKTKEVNAVADAMVVASMVEITNLVDIGSIAKQVMEKVDLSTLTGSNDSE